MQHVFAEWNIEEKLFRIFVRNINEWILKPFKQCIEKYIRNEFLCLLFINDHFLKFIKWITAVGIYIMLTISLTKTIEVKNKKLLLIFWIKFITRKLYSNKILHSIFSIIFTEILVLRGLRFFRFLIVSLVLKYR